MKPVSLALRVWPVLAVFSCAGEVATGRPQPAVLSAGDSQAVVDAQKALAVSQDYAPLYRLLASKQGDRQLLVDICSYFDPVFCLKKVSQQNPTLRADLCGTLSEQLKQSDVSQRLGADRAESFITLHIKDCELGIPQFVY